MKILIVTAAAIAMIASVALADNTPVFNISIKDHKFTPDTVEIPADTKVKLVVKNEDKTPEEFESHDLKLEKIIPGNSEATFTVTPRKAGEYVFFGEFNPKTAQGKLIVK
jgi:plastocyanin